MDLIKIRREFHRIPETDFCEIKTTKKIIAYLEKLDGTLTYGKHLYELSDENDIKDIDEGYTGALIRFGHAPYALFRADIDALPIKECESADHVPAKLGFISEHDGFMHACGHDGHIALALGLAEYFNAHKSLYQNRGIKILFQPAEEGVYGAAKMPKSITDDVDTMLGYHIGLGEPEGYIGVGSTDFYGVKKLSITFMGKAAHSANNPEDGISALDMALAFIDLTRSITFDAKHRRLMNIGMINGGTARNIIMSEITLGIDARSVDNDAIEIMYHQIESAAKSASEALGGEYQLKTVASALGYTEDNTELTKRISEALNAKNFKTTPNPDFGASEDVTKYMKEVKANGGRAIHLLLGAKLAGSHHSSKFDFNDSNLQNYFVAIIIAYHTMIEKK